MKARILVLAVALGLAFGAFNAIPVYADGDNCNGCCNYTTDCGSPSEWRCCLPQGAEAPCGTTPTYSCPGYCINQTSCTPVGG